MKPYRDNWDRRRWNHTDSSPGVRRAWRRARRIQQMSALHWQAYITFKGRKLIHNGGKP